jgi:hypothetical protein
MRQFTGGINWNTASGVDSMSAFLAGTCEYGPPGAPKRILGICGGDVRQASRQRASRARDFASRCDASIAPSWSGAPCVLGAAELAAHPRLSPRRWQPSMLDAANAHGAVVPLEQRRGTMGTEESRSRATEVVSHVNGLSRHPAALRMRPASDVAPQAAERSTLRRPPRTPRRLDEPATACAC